MKFFQMYHVFLTFLCFASHQLTMVQISRIHAHQTVNFKINYKISPRQIYMNKNIVIKLTKNQKNTNQTEKTVKDLCMRVLCSVIVCVLYT